MNICCQRREALAMRRGGKSVGCGNVAALPIQHVFEICCVALCNRIGDKPFHVHDNVLPAMLLQMCGHPVRVRLHLRLANGCPVRIPAVPSHGWSSSQHCPSFTTNRLLPMKSDEDASEENGCSQPSDMAIHPAHA